MKRDHVDAPSNDLDTFDLPSPCVEVQILWGASVLRVAHLAPPRAFHVGDAVTPRTAPLDVELPVSALAPGARWPVVLTRADGGVDLVLPEGAAGTVELDGEPARAVAEVIASDAAEPCDALPGARRIALPMGAKARLEVGPFVVCVAHGRAARNVAVRSFPARRSMPFVLGSAILQLGALAAAWMFQGPPENPNDPSGERIYQIQLALQAVEEKQAEAKEAEQVTEANADVKEGGTGTRARGEEGSMGAAPSRASNQRYGVAGPRDQADPHVARQEALRSSAEFGMIGLLNSGAGGDPNAPTAPWGRDDSLGSDPLSARGNMWGSDIGNAYGAGGLGLTGVGQGGGGIGTIGHGAGTGTAQGFGSGHGRLGGSHRVAAAAPPAYAPPPAYAAPPPAAPEIAIDPNGRFATTYRPGGGHLAAFESAVARGILPAATREVVSDVGARYTPAIEVPDDKALGLHVDFERPKLPPSGGPFHVRLALRSSAQHAAARPHLSVHLVLDVSGSMNGESIDRARDAATALVDKLDASDDFSLTTFSDDAELKVPDGPVGPRRGAIKGVIRGIGASGGTNIGAGLQMGYAQASLSTIPEDAVRVVLLLSDGRANGGITSSERLSMLAQGAFQKGIQTSSFGLGSDYDGALMSSIANDGTGGYYYLRSADQIAGALATELDKRLDPVATAVEVRVRLKKDVELLRVYGSRRLNEAEAARVRASEVAADRQASKRDRIATNRQDDVEGGMRFYLPAFARDDGHALLLKLSAPAGVGPRPVATVEVRYKDRIAKKNVTLEVPVEVAYADSDAASAASADPSVARAVQGFAAGEALTTAAQLIARGDRAGAVAILSEREAILRRAAGTLGEALLDRDADRLARLRMAAGGEATGMGDPLVLSMLLETAGRAHLR